MTAHGWGVRAALLVLVHAGLVRAEVLTEAQVRASVERHFPLVLAAQAELRAAEGERLASEGAFDPLLRSRAAAALSGPYENARADVLFEQPTSFYGASGFAGWRVSDGAFPAYDGKLETGPAGEARVGVTVPLLRNRATDRRRTSVARAERGKVVADANLEAARIATARVAASRYWDWVLAEERVQLANKMLALAEERRTATERRAIHGEIQGSEVLEGERGVLQRRSVVASAERALEQSRYELSLYVRDAEGAVSDAAVFDAPGLPLVEGVPPLRSEALRKAEATRPELVRMQAELERESLEAQFADNQTLLAADMGSAVTLPIAGDSQGYRVPTAEVTLALEFSPRNRAWQGRRAVAEASVERTRLNLAFTRDRIRVEVDDAISAWRRAAERGVAAASEKRVAQELARLERTRFELGDGTLFFVNLREQAAFEAELRDREARADLQKAVVQHRAAIGER